MKILQKTIIFPYVANQRKTKMLRSERFHMRIKAFILFSSHFDQRNGKFIGKPGYPPYDHAENQKYADCNKE